MFIASALAAGEKEENDQVRQLVTVDIIDVNDALTKPWLASGSPHSPAQLLETLGLREHVQFVSQRSVDYLASRPDGFDLIFLDGDHSAATVYQELPLALASLNSGGLILLHDYYPDGRSLWSDGKVIDGPWLALQRLESEGLRLQVVPFGTLPWPSKLGSQCSSLAILSAG